MDTTLSSLSIQEKRTANHVENPRTFSLPLATDIRRVNELQLEIFQKQLDQNQIGLDCLNVPPIKNRNSFNQQNIDAYLESIEDNILSNGKSWYEIRKKMFEKCSVISFEQLQAGLSICTQKLNELLKEFPYTVFFTPQTSREWVTTLALPLMNRTPRNSLLIGTDTQIMDTQNCPSSLIERELTIADRHLVIFDDVSYTGLQLQRTVRALQKSVQGVFGQEKISLYLVVPFISTVALKAMQDCCRRNPSINQNLDISLITTEHKPVAMTDVFSPEEFADLITIEDLETDEGHGKKVYQKFGQLDKCLTITNWKVPDTQSIPSTIQIFGPKNEQLRFVTDYKPPYKKEETKPFWL